MQLRVTQNIGASDYFVDRTKLYMRGWWVMDCIVSTGGQTDVAHFHRM